MVLGVGGEGAAACRIRRNVWKAMNFRSFGSAWGDGGRLQIHEKYIVMFILSLVHVPHLLPITWGGKKGEDGERPEVNIQEATQEQQIRQQQRRDKKHKKDMCIASHFQAATNIMQNEQCKYKQFARTIQQGTFRLVQVLVEGQDAQDHHAHP